MKANKIFNFTINLFKKKKSKLKSTKSLTEINYNNLEKNLNTNNNLYYKINIDNEKVRKSIIDKINKHEKKIEKRQSKLLYSSYNSNLYNIDNSHNYLGMNKYNNLMNYNDLVFD